jgi:WXG100 family type VII secretion target
MSDVNLTYEEMESAARQLSSAHEEITSRLSQLKAMVDELVQSGFVTRVASKSFEEAYTEFNRGVVQTIEGLDVMSRFLTAAVHSYQEADTTTRLIES